MHLVRKSVQPDQVFCDTEILEIRRAALDPFVREAPGAPTVIQAFVWDEGMNLDKR